ncbi:hypothetical protein V2J09_011987 [Rumex salicifolius]
MRMSMQLLVYFLVALSVSHLAESKENPFTVKAALIRYWNKHITNNLPKPEFLFSKASPLTTIESAFLSKLASENDLSSHVSTFCSSANLFCQFESQVDHPKKINADFSSYTSKPFTSYGAASVRGTDSFKNYSVGINMPTNTFTHYSSSSGGHNEMFTSYADNANVGDDGFTSYSPGSAGGSGEFTSYESNFNNYGETTNILGSTFTGYSEDATNANDTFKDYSKDANNPNNNFKGYNDGAKGGVDSFVNYRDGANVGHDTFQSYGKGEKMAKASFANYGKSFNEGTDSFNEYGKGSSSRDIEFKSYGVNNTFKGYGDIEKGISFASYTNKTSTKEGKPSPNRFVEQGRFFRESMLKQGNVMRMPDIKDKMPKRSFLPRSILNKLEPSKLTTIFNMEGIIKKTLEECNRAPSKGEMKRCVGSIEDMIDFSVSILGQNIIVRTTDNVNGSSEEVVIGEVKGINGGKVTKSVSCHQSMFPYLLYYCHSVPKVRAYEVDILSLSGNVRVNHGVAICHLDTSSWSASHGAFVALGSGPGLIEVCHWIFENDMTWNVAD